MECASWKKGHHSEKKNHCSVLSPIDTKSLFVISENVRTVLTKSRTDICNQSLFQIFTLFSDMYTSFKKCEMLGSSLNNNLWPKRSQQYIYIRHVFLSVYIVLWYLYSPKLGQLSYDFSISPARVVRAKIPWWWALNWLQCPKKQSETRKWRDYIERL